MSRLSLVEVPKPLQATPTQGRKVPEVVLGKALKATLEFFDATATTRNGGMKCKLNLEHAKSALWFGCRGMECLGGDFDLSQVLAQAVVTRRKVVTGELRCQGTRKRGDHEREPCGTLLHYKLNLAYD